ncbi:MAG: hypothetical protein P8010_26590 [Desulfosarcinaceae bacterium]
MLRGNAVFYEHTLQLIDANEMKVVPTPLPIDELESMLIEYGIAA